MFIHRLCKRYLFIREILDFLITKGRDKKMNIFEQDTRSDISLDDMRSKFEELLKLSVKIRQELGKYRYLFDRYFYFLLDNVNLTHAREAAERGFEAAHNLRHLCQKALKNSTDISDTKIYSAIKNFIDMHPIECIENLTKVEIYIVHLHNLYLKHAIRDFIEEEEEKENGPHDSFEAKMIYNKIIQITGNKESLDQFNKLFSDCFFINKKINMFIYGFLNNIIYSLCHEDIETRQLVFQLILNDIAESESDS